MAASSTSNIMTMKSDQMQIFESPTILSFFLSFSFPSRSVLSRDLVRCSRFQVFMYFYATVIYSPFLQMSCFIMDSLSFFFSFFSTIHFFSRGNLKKSAPSLNLSQLIFGVYNRKEKENVEPDTSASPHSEAESFPGDLSIDTKEQKNKDETSLIRV